MQTIEFLERAHAVKILVKVLKEEPIAKGILYGMLKENTEVMKKRVAEQINMDILKEEIVKKDGTQVRILTLTPKGRRVAEKLRDIEEIMGEP